MPNNFSSLRAEIEKTIDSYEHRLPEASELSALETRIAALQEMSRRETPRPEKGPLPPFPALPLPLPPVPFLPESEKCIELRQQLTSEKLLLEEKLRNAMLEKRNPGALRHRLNAVSNRFKFELPKLLKEGVPTVILAEREKLVKAHGNYAKDLVKIREKWRAECVPIDQDWAARLRVWKAANSPSGLAIRKRAVRRILDRFKGLTSPHLPQGIKRLPWRLLPAPEPGPKGLERLIKDLQRHCPTLRFNEERLRFPFGLNPMEIYCGTDEFDGYLAFVFRDNQKVLLESPMEGNAAYVFRANWRTLSKFSKSELLQNHLSEVGRVFHRGDFEWKSRLKSMLQ
jgi:hypothetical protein